MKLLIAIPALDEQDSIASTIERCLDAREHIIANSPVTEVNVTVVSDGSTDRTVEIAKGYTDRIGLIVFEKNKGYGAAISEAWMSSDADLLSFLDADGTCDPTKIAEFCDALMVQSADVVLGCRLNKNSQMPLVRRIGNTMFAWMLSLFSMTRVKDTASGMRVVRRTSLKKLFPLPRGLHFTPAMSARAIMSRDLKIIEIDMLYDEREGESKLNPVKDGIRFLRVILETAMLYRPSKPMGLVATVMLLVTVAMMAGPSIYYLENGRLEEWMIYRFLVGELLSTIAVLIWCVTYLGRKAADIGLSSNPEKDKYHGFWGWVFSRKWLWAVPTALGGIGLSFVWRALMQYFSTGEVTEHWSRFVAMMFFFSAAAIVVVCKIADYCLNLLADRLAYLKAVEEQTEPIPHA
jgi:glycosyltransferase involved in cell wall biosynthesis